MRYFAILVDAFHETRDRKTLYVLLVISAVFILLLAGIGYQPLEPQVALDAVTSRFNQVLVRGLNLEQKQFDTRFVSTDIRKLDASAGDFADGYSFRLTVSPIQEFHHLIRAWDGADRRAYKPHEAVPDYDVPADESLEVRFLDRRLREGFFVKRDVKRVASGDDSRTFEIRAKPANPQALQGGHQCSLMFGLWSFPLDIGVAMFLVGLQSFLSEYFAGFAGVFIALVITAGSVPGMLQKGSVEILLSKPVHRPTYLLFKYLGGLTYAAVTGLVFIGGSWLVMSSRAGLWNWGYLATFGTLMLFFAVLYSISVFAGVLTRSTIASIGAPIVAWAGGSAINFVKNLLANPLLDITAPRWATTTLDVVAWFFPRAGDLNILNRLLLFKGSYGEGVEAAVREQGLPSVNWVTVFGSSGLMIAVMLGLACWIFSRRDP